MTVNVPRKNSLRKHVIKNRTKQGREERKKEGDGSREAEIYSGTVGNPDIRTPGLGCGVCVLSASFRRKKKQTKLEKTKNKNISHQALIGRHPLISFLWSLFSME